MTQYLNLQSAGFTGALDMSGRVSLLQANCSVNLFTSATFSGCSALTFLSIRGCKLMTTLDVSDLPALTFLDANECSSLIALDVSELLSLSSLDIGNCVSLPGVDVSAAAALTSLDASSCAIVSVPAIDKILDDLDTNGLSNGAVDLSGGTNAVPSAAGLVSKGLLEGKGWTVKVNE